MSTYTERVRTDRPVGPDDPGPASTPHLLARATEAPDVPRLRVRGLSVAFGPPERRTDVVRDVSFDLPAGRCVALVGESGSGKSVTARSLVGLAGPGALVTADALELDGQDVRRFDRRRWRQVRGGRVGFVLQDALVSLDPLRPVGREVAEALRLHGVRPAAERRRRVHELLASVGMPEPELRARQRPHELSGGLRQRALIASAVANAPDVVIADEPTTALDVAVQAQVLAELARMRERGVTLLLISHDLAVVSRLADEVVVMKDGRVVEQGPTEQVLRAPQHAWTRRLVAAVPGLGTRGRRLSPTEPTPPGDGAAAARPEAARAAARPEAARGAGARVAADVPVLQAVGLVKRFRAPDGSTITAVDGVSFSLHRGRTLGLVGESGSGKSTTARLALALETADAGHVTLLGQPWTAVPERSRRALRPRIAVVQQDPLSAFDPRWTVGQVLADALVDGVRRSPQQVRERVEELLGLVSLDLAVLDRSPLRLSGGQRQRVAIARALAGGPDVVVLDEAVSALDVSVQAQVLDLLVDLQRRLGVAYLCITHDLGVVAHLSDSVMVMKDGAVVEQGEPQQVLTRPTHPYTQRLVAALPELASPERSTR